MTVQNHRMIDHRLHVLRMLAQHGTVTAAAHALHYTPSAVSAQLRSLSEAVGVPLLVPHGRGVKLTAAGRLLLNHSHGLFEHWERIQASVVAGAGETLGELRLGGFSTAAAALMTPVAAELNRRHSRLDVRIIEAEPEECFELLLADRIDVAVVVSTLQIPTATDRRFEQAALLEDPLDLLVGANHHAAGRTTIELREVAAERWIVDRPGKPYHQLFVTACSAAGFVPEIAHEAVEWDTAAALVGAGLGTALIPQLARLPTGYPVVRVPLHGNPVPSRRILTSIRRGSRELPVISETLRVLSSVAGDIQKSQGF
jgi:DNA-binding transcriptional LysR family regulator